MMNNAIRKYVADIPAGTRRYRCVHGMGSADVIVYIYGPHGEDLTFAMGEPKPIRPRTLLDRILRRHPAKVSVGTVIRHTSVNEVVIDLPFPAPAGTRIVVSGW